MSHIELLKRLIRTPSFSGQEDKTATIIAEYLQQNGVEITRIKNNIISRNKHFNPASKTILLNSHHDTVKDNEGWIKDPFGAEEVGDTIYGLGSNDAGGSLISLIATFIQLHDKPLPYNLVMVASAEEETFGKNGLSSLLDHHLPHFDLGIIGEPTSLELAVAEKGLLVLDGESKGVSGHAARNTGTNAIYRALEDIEWLRQFTFEKVSENLGPVTLQVTQIEAGYQHNVIPDSCRYVVDVRVNDCYTNEEIVNIIQQNIKGSIQPRSLKWNSRYIPAHHPIVKRAKDLGIRTFGSPTLSDQVHCRFPTVKIGPGDSERSHTPDEYILKSEIEKGIATYIRLLDGLEL